MTPNSTPHLWGWGGPRGSSKVVPIEISSQHSYSYSTCIHTIGICCTVWLQNTTRLTDDRQTERAWTNVELQTCERAFTLLRVRQQSSTVHCNVILFGSLSCRQIWSNRDDLRRLTVGCKCQPFRTGNARLFVVQHEDTGSHNSWTIWSRLFLGIFGSVSWRQTWPNHDNLRRFTVDRKSSWHPATTLTCCHTYSFVSFALTSGEAYPGLWKQMLQESAWHIIQRA